MGEDILVTLYSKVKTQLMTGTMIHWKLIKKDFLISEYSVDFLDALSKKYSTVNDIKEKMYLYLYKFDTKPTCKYCNKELVWKDRGQKGGRNYGQYCNKECLLKDPQNSINSVIKNLERQYNVIYKDVETYLQKYNLVNLTLSEQFYLYLNKITKIPLCSECGKECKYQDSERGYGQFCSINCSSSNKEIVEKKHFSRHDINKQELDEYCKKYNFTKNSLGEKIYLFLNKVTSLPICKVCGKNTKYFSQKEGYHEYCSKTCFNSVMHKLALESNLKKYYKRHINGIEQIVDIDKSNITFENYKEKGSEGKYEFVCKSCNHSFIDYLSYNGLPRCLKCIPYNTSFEEQLISQYLLSLGLIKSQIDIRKKDTLEGKELDLYLPEHKLAIEYNGLMRHSFGKSSGTKFNNFSLESHGKNNHLIKTESCQKKGIQLLHINENEWLNPIKQDIWKSIMKSKLGLNDRLFARKLKIQAVSYQDSCKFLNDSHLQGEDKASIRLGLYQFTENGDELVSLMTFGKSRYDKKVAWELHRFANKKYTTVVGGASKLFSHFQENHLQVGESIISYADRRHSNGNLYEKLGFSLSHSSSPNYFYFKEDNVLSLESRLNYQKHKLKDKLAIFDETLTESENMYNNGFRKIYDSGNLVYIYNK